MDMKSQFSPNKVAYHKEEQNTVIAEIAVVVLG